LDLPEQGTFAQKFLLSEWKPENIPKESKDSSETFEETITYLKTVIVDGKEIRSYLKKRVSAQGNVFLSLTKRQMSESEKYRIELFNKLDAKVYESLLQGQRDEERKTIHRTTTQILHNLNQYYVEKYADFALVRVNHFEGQEITLPEWFGENKDVTEDEKYFSYNLSNPNFKL
jgi:CYTH domain-containing protein